ncbi:MAG: ribose 5-phosphate isomerase B [Candidatus Omnitrophica bacterium]|nr:ribose 5-phosphate isomerase B [Candidatus Omnitrophota bacterium]
MKVYIGADHRGVQYKAKIIKELEALGLDVIDFGAHDESASCDYPKVAYKVATRVAQSKNARGVLVCMSGIGQSMAANKVPGSFAALCYNAEAAKLSRQHNNANVLVLSSKFVKPKELPKILKIWFSTEFEGGRHRRRVNQMKKIEKGIPLN